MADFRKLTEAVIVDTETTGVDTKTARIISLAMAKVNFGTAGEDNSGRVTIHYELASYVFDPGLPIPPDATRVNGFSDEMVRGKNRFHEQAREIRDFIGDAPIIAHNVKFDGWILDAEFSRAGVPAIPKKRGHRWCTMMEAHRRACAILGEDTKWPKLSEAAPYAGVRFSQSQTHEATEDVLNTLKLVLGFRNTRVRNGRLEDFRERSNYAPRSPQQKVVASSYKRSWPEDNPAPVPTEARETNRRGWIFAAFVIATLILVFSFRGA